MKTFVCLLALTALSGQATAFDWNDASGTVDFGSIKSSLGAAVDFALNGVLGFDLTIQNEAAAVAKLDFGNFATILTGKISVIGQKLTAASMTWKTGFLNLAQNGQFETLGNIAVKAPSILNSLASNVAPTLLGGLTTLKNGAQLVIEGKAGPTSVAAKLEIQGAKIAAETFAQAAIAISQAGTGGVLSVKGAAASTVTGAIRLLDASASVDVEAGAELKLDTGVVADVFANITGAGSVALNGALTAAGRGAAKIESAIQMGVAASLKAVDSAKLTLAAVASQSLKAVHELSGVLEAAKDATIEFAAEAKAKIIAATQFTGSGKFDIKGAITAAADVTFSGTALATQLSGAIDLGMSKLAFQAGSNFTLQNGGMITGGATANIDFDAQVDIEALASNAAKIAIDAALNFAAAVNVKANALLNITAAAKAQLKASAKLAIQAGAQFLVDAKAQLEVKVGAVVSGAGELVVKGKLLLDAAVELAAKLKAQADVTIKGDVYLKAGSEFSLDSTVSLEAGIASGRLIFDGALTGGILQAHSAAGTISTDVAVTAKALLQAGGNILGNVVLSGALSNIPDKLLSLSKNLTMAAASKLVFTLDAGTGLKPIVVNGFVNFASNAAAEVKLNGFVATASKIKLMSFKQYTGTISTSATRRLLGSAGTLTIEENTSNGGFDLMFKADNQSSAASATATVFFAAFLAPLVALLALLF